MRANRMLVRTAEKTSDGRVSLLLMCHCSRAAGVRGRGRQAEAMGKAGRRKAGKATSSKGGARRGPKAGTSQTSDGVRKKSLTGMFLGRETREETAWMETDRTMPMGMRR